MINHRKAVAVASATLAVVGVNGAAQAGGFYLPDQSVKAIGRAYSGEAADQGPESLWWNPASIGGIANGSVYFGGAGIFPSERVNDTGSVIVRPGQAPAPVGGDPSQKDPVSSGLVPSGAIAYPITKQVSVGLSLTSPYSFTTNYDANSWARYSADKTKLVTIDIQPTLAIAPTSWLRLGAGPNIEYTDATLSNRLPNLSSALPDGDQRLKGNGWDAGWSVGAQLHNDVVTLGLAYKSSIEHTLKGGLVVSGLLGPLAGSNASLSGIEARFSTPWQAIASVRVHVIEALTLNLQATRFGWSKFDSIRLGAPLNAALPEGYRDTWTVAGGVDYVLSPKWTVRAGFDYDQTPTRNGARDARVPDANRRGYSTGATYNLTPSFSIDAAASYVDFSNASIDRPTAAFAGTPVQTPILVAGEVRNAHALVFALGGRFSF